MIVVTRRGAAGIAWIVDARRRRVEDVRLLPRNPAEDGLAVMVYVYDRRIVVPVRPVRNGQVGPQFELILEIGAVFLGACIDRIARVLCVLVGNPQQEIRARIPGGVGPRPAKRIGTAQVGQEGIVDFHAPHLKAHLERMGAHHLGEVIGGLIGLLNARLRTIAGEAEIKVAGQGDVGQAGVGGDLGSDVESYRGRQRRVRREVGSVIEAVVAQPRLIQSGAAERMVPSQRAVEVSCLVDFGKPRQAGPGNGRTFPSGVR